MEHITLHSLALFAVAAILLPFANGAMVSGLQRATHEGYLLNPVKEWLVRIIGVDATRPILGCPRCMASVWGGIPMLALIWFATGLSLPLCLLLAFAHACATSAWSCGISQALHLIDDEE